MRVPGHYGCTNLALSGVASASASWSGVPGDAFDGEVCTTWNAGSFAGNWVAVDLGVEQPITGRFFYVNQSPPGTTSHVIALATSPGAWTSAMTLTGATKGGDVRVRTTQTPSWVSWSEISVWRCP